MAEKKDTIIIPSLPKRIIQKAKISLRKGGKSYSTLFILIFILWVGLLLLITYLPISPVLKVLSLLIGTFLLEDIHHSLKKYVSKIDGPSF